MMDSGNFNTMHGVVTLMARMDSSDNLVYVATLNGIEIGQLRRAEDMNVYYKHSVDDKNFITAVTDSFSEAAQELASFAFKVGVI